MKPLPSGTYEPAVWTQAKVGSDYLIADGTNKYSVPFDLIGETVDIRLTKNTVEVFYHSGRVASHKPAQREPIVHAQHMPREHQKYLSYNTDSFTQWAESVGKNKAKIVASFLTSGKEPEQGHKSCVSLMKLVEKHGVHRIEVACERMLSYTSSPSIRTISIMLKNGQEKSADTTEAHTESKTFGITRGAEYFSKNNGGESDD